MWSAQPKNVPISSSTITQESELPVKIRLGIWGGQAAGKTVYAIMLHHYLMNLKEAPWRVSCKDTNTSEFVLEGRRKIIDHGEMPPATATTNDPKVYSYLLKSKNNSIDIELSFFDLSGEVYTNRRNDILIPDPDNISESISIPQYLNKCHGVIFLISPLEKDKPMRKTMDGRDLVDGYGNLLQELIEDMLMDSRPESGKIEQYVSFCITKADHSEVHQFFSQNPPEQSLLKILGRNYQEAWFDNFFYLVMDKDNKRFATDPMQSHRCQVFYVSPFGVYKDDNGEYKSPVILSKSANENCNSTLKSAISSHPFSSTSSVSTMQENDDFTYEIDLNAPAFQPINMITPIEWLIRGVLQNPPNLK